PDISILGMVDSVRELFGRVAGGGGYGIAHCGGENAENQNRSESNSKLSNWHPSGGLRLHHSASSFLLGYCAFERALPLADGEAGVEPSVDIGLHCGVAREHVGLFEPSPWRHRHRAQFRMQPRLVVGFEPVGDHYIGAPGHELVEDAGVVMVDNDSGAL